MARTMTTVAKVLSMPACSEEELPLLMMRVNQLWRQRLDARLSHLGLSQAKWRALATIALSEEGMNQSELAGRMGIEGPSLVALLDRLSRDGWVSREVSCRDRRCKILRLTDKATPLIEEIAAVAETLRQELLQDVSYDELQCCAAVMRKIRDRALSEES
jgi:MarR family transcriptional regulator for hemolysin